MSTIKIEGTFSESINNFVQIDMYRPNPDAYDFSKQYKKSFDISIDDLKPGHSYFFDLTGYTTGNFEIKVTGDITDPVDETYSNSFEPGFAITTNLSDSNFKNPQL